MMEIVGSLESGPALSSAELEEFSIEHLESSKQHVKMIGLYERSTLVSSNLGKQSPPSAL
jgi:hypothetical protein